MKVFSPQSPRRVEPLRTAGRQLVFTVSIQTTCNYYYCTDANIKHKHRRLRGTQQGVKKLMTFIDLYQTTAAALYIVPFSSYNLLLVFIGLYLRKCQLVGVFSSSAL